MAGNKGQVNMFPDFETLATHFDEVLAVLCRKCSVFFLFFLITEFMLPMSGP